MRKGLDSINMLNKSYQPFTVTDVRPYVQYFDDHGTSNDRVLAYYLMGRAYHDQREAPMALEFYQKATELADTTESDFDFSQLSKVYGQMADIFYQQNLHHHIDLRNLSIKYAVLGGDTLAALYNYEQKCGTYERKNRLDSALMVADSLISWYHHHRLTQDSAISCGRAFTILVDMGDFEKARIRMNTFEALSGLIDNHGFIRQGYEVYYYSKSLLLIHEDKLDSAEYWLREELNTTTDFNNQNAAAQGLSQYFENKQLPDSALKYALYSYAMNDSAYAQMTTKEVEQVQAMYDYTRNQVIAQQQSEIAQRERAKWLLTLLLTTCLCFAGYVIIAKLLEKKKENEKKYKDSLFILEQAQTDIIQLRAHEIEFKDLIASKESIIDIQRRELQKYRKWELTDAEKKEKMLKETKTFREIEAKIFKGKAFNENDWQNLHFLVIEYLPQFNEFLLSRKHQLNINEYHICILLRMHFISKEIGTVLNITPARVSQISAVLCQKLFKTEGNGKVLSAKLCELN